MTDQLPVGGEELSVVSCQSPSRVPSEGQLSVRDQLVRVSRALGEDLMLVQAGGGNTSLKTDHETMWVKASGRRLRDVSAEDGFVSVRYPSIEKFYAGLSTPDGIKASIEASDNVKKSVIAGTGRPSMETGFHALLGAAVLHSHPVIPNIITCAGDGPTMFRELLQDQDMKAQWIPYRQPGHELTFEIFENLKSQGDPSHEQIFFLQNHGIIVSATSLSRAEELHLEVIAKTKVFLEKSFGKGLPSIDKLRVSPQDYFVKGHAFLTPDEAVFCADLDHYSYPEADVMDVARSIVYILEIQKSFNLKPQFIDDLEARRILDMESEKYRQELARNKI